MEGLSFEIFVKKYDLKNDIMIESELRRVYIYPIYPGDSKNVLHKRYVNIDNNSMGGIHWVCFVVKDNKSYYFIVSE